MTQLIENGTRFAGHTVVRKLSARHDGCREVYLAKCPDVVDGGMEDIPENYGILTVFDIKSERYAVEGASRRRVPDFIEEVEFLRSRQSGTYFLKALDCGIEKAGKRRLGWMLQQNIDANSLANEIRLQRGLCMADVIKVMDALFDATGELTRHTRGGGHYNITPDNILLDYDGDNLKRVCLIGLSDMGKACYGSASFNDGMCDMRFRAPETANGVFSHLTDIYALGMVMAMMISGDMGDDLIDGSGRDLSSADFHKMFMRRNHGNLSVAQRLVLEKATDANPSARFQTIDRFRAFAGRLAKGNITTHTHVEMAAPVTAGAGGSAVTEGGDSRFARLGREKTKATDAARKSPGGLDEVAGMSELKALFRRDFIRIVRNPGVAGAYGIRPSNCTLLYGPQGCGKTFIAEKAAQESGLRYRIVNPSELGSIYIHGSQQKIAELFDEAEKKGPMILIFDEFDALVPKRDNDHTGNQANEVNEMLTRLNNCASRGIYVLATTNRPGLLDPAIMRKGRVDRTVYVSLPDKEARRELFRLEIEKRPFADIDYEVLASATENYTCSDISFIVEETARLCFEETLDRGLDRPLPLSMDGLMKVISATRPSVSDKQRREYLELKEEIENLQTDGGRKKVGFTF